MSQEPFQYSPPPTASGARPTTSTGKRPGTSNPFRQLVEQQQEGTPTLGVGVSMSSFQTGDPQSGPPTYSYDYDSRNPYSGYGRPPPSSYGRPPPSSHGFGYPGGIGVGASSSYGYPSHGGRYPEDDVEEEDEEESDDEDVFAFLPPTTAEVEDERKRKEEEERRTKELEERAERERQQQQIQLSQLRQAEQPRREQEDVARHLALLGGPPHASTSANSIPMMRPITAVDEEEEARIRARQDPLFAFSISTDGESTKKRKKRRSGGESSQGEHSPITPSRRQQFALTADSEDYGRQIGQDSRQQQEGLHPYGASSGGRYAFQYAPPVSPPSTESNEGSRAGMGSGDGFKMTRLDRDGRRSGEERRSSERDPELKSGERERDRKSLDRDEDKYREREDESVTVAASFEGVKDLGSPTSKGHGNEDDADKSKEEGERAAKEREKERASYGKHWQHFQPNPARHNPNSGPYKRHREYHYNQAYPQYAAKNRSVTSSRGVDGEGSAGATASGAFDGSTSVNGESNRKKKRKGSKAPGTDNTVNTTATSEYLASSEYTDTAHTHGAAGTYGSRPDTGLNSLGYLRETSRSDLDEYEDFGDDDYEFDGESREGSIKMEFDFDAIEDEDSPYPEVRASVSNIDDPDMPAMTIRMWVVGLILCMVSSAFNVFFNFRSPGLSIVPLVLLLLSYPIGKFLAFTLPITTYRIPLPYLPSTLVPSSLPTVLLRVLRPLTFPHAIEFSLNPGPWNIKEHVLVYIMANVAVGSPYALNAIVVLEVFYEFETGYWFSLVLVLATQLTGFGLAGMCRRFLVWPASMVWPQNLVACTLLNTLHAEDEDDGIGMLGGPTLEDDPNCEGGRRRKRGMSRYKFFVWTTVGSFVFFFLPGYLFQALSIFSFVCWAAPDNIIVNQLFGVRSGLGMSMLTFDWSQITWIGSPLMVPWWAEVHVFAGFVLFYWILTPILYYTNAWQLAYFPISDTSPYDRFGNRYNIGRVLKHDDTFDEEAYNAYSPLFLPATYALTYLLAFCLSTCVIVHTVLYHGHTLLNGFKKIRVENDDIHAKLMRNYPEVPDWWYLCAFGVFFALAIVAVEIWDTSVPVWALLLSVALPVIYILPSGFIYAMTGQGINLNILAQIIPGTLLPGKPLANMVFKAYSVQTLSEATNFVQDLKLGHYVKVPPRATFLVQMIATTLAAFIQVGVKHWIFTNVKDICQRNQPSQLTCPHNQVFFTASAVWGLIGPTRQFGKGSIYHPHLYAIIIGVFLPIPFWLWRRRYPNSWVKWVSTPVVLNGVSWIPPATGINYSSWFMVGFLFQYVVRKRNFAWWSKFNYVLSSALDSGTVIAVIVIFFTLQFPKGGIQLDWWGNTVHTQTADYAQKPLLPIPDGGIPWRN